MTGEAVVVGAGIAGLAAARGLLAAGWRVQVRERSDGLPVTGTSLGMWPAAMRALDDLGLGEEVRAASVEARGGRILRPDGRTLARLGPERSVRMVPRPVLLEALARDLPPGTIAWHRPAGDPDLLPDADVVVAADGVHSPVRTALFGVAERPLGTLAIRGRALLPAEGVTETWGPGRIFGITPYDATSTYWYACFRAELLPEPPPAGATAEVLRGLYRGWHPEVQQVLAALDETSLDRRELLDVPPLRSYVTARTALVGDAAHAMAPNLGRGAAEALVDATTLVDALTEDAEPLVDEAGVAAALRHYDAVRRPPTTRLVRAARLLNRMSTGHRLVRPRDLALAAVGRLV